VLQADVELVGRGGALVGAAAQPAPEPFDLEKALERVVGVDAVKSHILRSHRRTKNTWGFRETRADRAPCKTVVGTGWITPLSLPLS
jgi:hypothetical protein